MGHGDRAHAVDRGDLFDDLGQDRRGRGMSRIVQGGHGSSAVVVADGADESDHRPGLAVGGVGNHRLVLGQRDRLVHDPGVHHPGGGISGHRWSPPRI